MVKLFGKHDAAIRIILTITYTNIGNINTEGMRATREDVALKRTTRECISVRIAKNTINTTDEYNNNNICSPYISRTFDQLTTKATTSNDFHLLIIYQSIILIIHSCSSNLIWSIKEAYNQNF
jgi:hypothetical protein